MSDILEKNLANIEFDFDIFGNKIEKLSMRDRIGFLPISIWEPDWKITTDLKKIVGDNGGTRELTAESQKNLSYKQNLGSHQNQVSIFNPHLAQLELLCHPLSILKVFPANY